MTVRNYYVSTYTYNDTVEKHMRGKVSRYKVTDAYDNETEKERPPVAEFVVSVLYDAETQKVRAEKLAEYLNDVNSKIGMYQILTSTTIVPAP